MARGPTPAPLVGASLRSGSLSRHVGQVPSSLSSGGKAAHPRASCRGLASLGISQSTRRASPEFSFQWREGGPPPRLLSGPRFARDLSVDTSGKSRVLSPVAGRRPTPAALVGASLRSGSLSRHFGQVPSSLSSGGKAAHPRGSCRGLALLGVSQSTLRASPEFSLQWREGGPPPRLLSGPRFARDLSVDTSGKSRVLFPVAGRRPTPAALVGASLCSGSLSRHFGQVPSSLSSGGKAAHPRASCRGLASLGISQSTLRASPEFSFQWREGGPPPRLLSGPRFARDLSVDTSGKSRVLSPVAGRRPTPAPLVGASLRSGSLSRHFGQVPSSLSSGGKA